MSQHDYSIADQAGTAFLADLNSALAAIVSANSGATEPATMFAYQFWADTTTGILKQRNAANTAWISLMTLSTGVMLNNASLAGSAAQVFNVGAGGAAAAAAVRQDEVRGGFKNKIIGGDFTTNPWQRGTSFTNPDGLNTADRFIWIAATDGAVNVLKTTDAPTAAEAGVFTQHCLHVDVTSIDVSVAPSHYAGISQKIEGFNAAAFGFGQAGTRYITLSFWHKHTKLGIYTVGFRNASANRSYVAEYTQDVTDTWERATITIPVDTTGTWLYGSGNGLNIFWNVAAGTDYQTTPNMWAAGNFQSTVNQVNALDSTSNNFKIALVQLEAGQVATPFETRPFGMELALCQRYLPAYTFTSVAGPFGQAQSATTSSFQIPFITQARTAPTGLTIVSGGGTFKVTQSNGVNVATTDPTFNSASVNGAKVDCTGSDLTAGHSSQLNAANALIVFTGCEL